MFIKLDIQNQETIRINNAALKPQKLIIKHKKQRNISF
jgi:hypothetical protein